MISRELRLLKAGDELVASIRNAAWLCRNKPNLSGPTPHMRRAIEDFEMLKYDPCPECGNPRRPTHE